MKFLWGLLTGAFLGAILTMWYVNKKLGTQPATEVVAAADDVPEDFVVFLERFGSDSLFQISRISFPLAGLPAYADSITMIEKNFRYRLEDWVMHRPIDLSASDFQREYQVAGDAMVIENLIDRKNGFGIQRRFAKLSDDWHLIYYAGVNKIE